MELTAVVAGREAFGARAECESGEIPLGRVGTTYEIWLAVKFVIECDFFTGRVIGVDGGSTF